MKIFGLLLLLFTSFCWGQKVQHFNQKHLDAYKFDESKYDSRTKDSYHYLRTQGDTATYFIDPSAYKGILNYGVDFASKDKRTFTFIENYNVFYTDVVFEKCTFSPKDSIAEIEGRVTGGWNTVDFKGGPPADLVEVAVGNLKKDRYVIYFNFGLRSEKLTITYKGQEKKESFPLDTLKTYVFEKYRYKKAFRGTEPFKIKVKVDKNTVMSIGKLSCFAHFYNIGALFYADRPKQVAKPRKDKNAPRLLRIIENNVQVNDAKNQLKKQIPSYYQFTEKAEAYILSRQMAKAKETYVLLAKEHQTLFATDIHNAIRVSVLSRDVKAAFWWGEKMAAKGVALPYFNSKIFSAMRKNPQWKNFSVRYDSILKAAQANWNLKLKKEINDLLIEDQTDYGLTNRKDPEVLYETTVRVTDKFIVLLKEHGYPSEEKIGAFTKNDTLLIQSPDFHVIMRHAVQQKPKGLEALNDLLNENYQSLEFDLKRSNTHRNFPGACFHIYKGNLYIDKSCDYNSQAMVRKMVFMFNNPNKFIIDNGNYIISEYNAENPKEWDDHYQNNFNFITKLTDDWEFYEK